MQSLATQVANPNNAATNTLVTPQTVSTPQVPSVTAMPQTTLAPQQVQQQYYPQYSQALPAGSLPQQYYAVPPQASSSGVNIVIYNPSVNPTAGSVANSNNNYNMAPQQAYPPNYYLQPQQPVPSSAVAESYIASTPITEQPKPEQPAPVEKKEETHKEEVVQLTDDYIKTLENYLNNDDVKIREMGIKQLLDRFKEHKSRKNDIALTCLLNKALQDPSNKIRFVALGILDAGYATGDAKTKELLTKMQSSKSMYGEDALMASEILLKTAGNKVEIDVPGPKPELKEPKKDTKSKKA